MVHSVRQQVMYTVRCEVCGDVRCAVSCEVCRGQIRGKRTQQPGHSPATRPRTQGPRWRAWLPHATASTQSQETGVTSTSLSAASPERSVRSSARKLKATHTHYTCASRTPGHTHTYTYAHATSWTCTHVMYDWSFCHKSSTPEQTRVPGTAAAQTCVPSHWTCPRGSQ